MLDLIWNNYCSELNLVIAAYISEQVTDEVYESLMRSYKALLGDSSGIKMDSPIHRHRLSSSDSSRHGASDISITDSSHQSDHSPLVSNFVFCCWHIHNHKGFFHLLTFCTEVGVLKSRKYISEPIYLLSTYILIIYTYIIPLFVC